LSWLETKLEWWKHRVEYLDIKKNWWLEKQKNIDEIEMILKFLESKIHKIVAKINDLKE